MDVSNFFQKNSYKGKRFRGSYTHPVKAVCKAVFYLLCPVREAEWLTGWKYGMVYSESGIAELDAIFTTWYGAEQFWYVSRYVPHSIIEFVRIEEKRWIERLSITLTDAGDGNTNVCWDQVTTALTAEGEGVIGFWEEQFLAVRKSVENDLNRYFELTNSNTA